MDELERAIEEAVEAQGKGLPSKTCSQLVAEGVKHAGGLEMLAAAERRGTLFGGRPRRPKLRIVK
jgi:hypothetical protein